MFRRETVKTEIRNIKSCGSYPLMKRVLFINVNKRKNDSKKSAFDLQHGTGILFYNLVPSKN